MSSSIAPLGPEDSGALQNLLSRDPSGNLYFLGVLDEYGGLQGGAHSNFAVHGRTVRGALTAAIFVGGDGGLVVPSRSDALDLGRIAESLVGHVHMRASVGASDSVDALMRQLGPKQPRVCRTHRLFTVSADDLGPFTNPTLRLATETDLPRVLPLAASYLKEVFDRDPIAEDPEGFRLRVYRRIKAKRTYVLEQDGEIVFKIDVGSRSQYGAELEGLYTVPSQRRLGHATLTLGQISRHLLSSLPRLTLRIEEGSPLAAIARKVGFVPGHVEKLVVAE